MDFIQFYEMFFFLANIYVMQKQSRPVPVIFFWYDAGTSAVGTYYERVVKKVLDSRQPALI